MIFRLGRRDIYSGICKFLISICYLDLVLPFAPLLVLRKNDMHNDELGIARMGICQSSLP
jgi:hypothetical protein